MHSVNMEHPSEGTVVVSVPKNGACVLCINTKDIGFAYISWTTLLDLLNAQDGSFRKCFLEARAFKAEEVAVTWAGQQAMSEKAFDNAAAVMFDGWSREQFIRHHNNTTPEQLGIPPVPQEHPLHPGTSIDVYYTPRPGPLFELRVGVHERSRWQMSCMPQQIYAEQGLHTLSHLHSKMHLQENVKGVLMDRPQYDKLLAQAKVGHVASGGGAMASGPVVSGGSSTAWTKVASSGAGAAPLKLQRPTPRMEMDILKTPISKVSRAPALAASSIRMASSPEACAKRSTVSLSQGASAMGRHAANRVGPPRDVTAWKAASRDPIYKRAPSVAGVASPGRAASAADANGESPVPTAVVTSFAGRVPLARETSLLVTPCKRGGSFDAVSQAESSGTRAKKRKSGTGDLTGHARAIAEARLEDALAGHPMRQHLINLRRASTIATEADGPNDVDNEPLRLLREHIQLISCGATLVWSNMPESPWVSIVSAATKVHDALGGALPPMTFAHLASRYALEFVQPRAKTTDFVKFWQAVALESSCDKVPQTLTTPSLWNNGFTPEQYDCFAVPAFARMVIEAMLIPNVNKGRLGIAPLLDISEAVWQKVDLYSSDLKAKLSDLRQKLRLVFMLHGKVPGTNGCSVKDVEDQILLKKDPFIVAVMAKDSVHRAAVDNVWSLSASESRHWPPLEAELAAYKGTKDVNRFLNYMLEKYASFQGQIRASAVAVARDTCEDAVVSTLNSMDFNSAVDQTEVVKRKSVVAKTRKLQAFIKSDALAAALHKSIDFVAKVTSAEIKDVLLSGCETFCREADPMNADAIQNFGRCLPTDQSVVVILEGTDAIQIALKAALSLVKLIAGSWPQAAAAVKVGVAFWEKVSLQGGSEAESKDAKKISDEIAAFNKLLHLVDAEEKYRSLGESVQARVDADKQLVVVRALIRQQDSIDVKLIACMKEAFKNYDTDVAKLYEVCNRHVKDHGAVYVTGKLPDLEKAHNALKPMAGGDADGAVWSKHLKDDCTLTELVDQAKASIMRLDSKALIPLIKSCAQASLSKHAGFLSPSSPSSPSHPPMTPS